MDAKNAADHFQNEPFFLIRNPVRKMERNTRNSKILKRHNRTPNRTAKVAVINPLAAASVRLTDYDNVACLAAFAFAAAFARNGTSASSTTLRITGIGR